MWATSHLPGLIDLSSFAVMSTIVRWVWPVTAMDRQYQRRKLSPGCKRAGTSGARPPASFENTEWPDSMQ